MKNIYKYLFNENNNISLFILLGIIFYIMTYISVGGFVPNAIPVHHDDYSNYARILSITDLSLVRPLSTFIIQVLSNIHPEVLIYGIRILTVSYVFLIFYLISEIFEIRINFIYKLIICIAIFSTPISIEYSRYTGMITHLISGNLAFLAIILLSRSLRVSKMYLLILSSVFMFLSVISKEDFILFYLGFILYFFIKNYSKKVINFKVTLIILVGIIFIFGVILFSKLAISSSFLGTIDKSSTYYLSIIPSSIIETIVKYLSGANHPSMLVHGQFVLLIFIFALFVNLYFIRDNASGFFITFISVLIILPYSVLPNHINAYYEILWIPFIYIGFFIAIKNIFNIVSSKLISISVCLISAFIFLGLLFVDFQPRKSIGNWYDTISKVNKNNIEKLLANKDVINTEKQVCILGADSFSPWFMHNGNYLKNVLGINSQWFVVPLNLEFKQGFLLSEQMSANIKIVDICPENIFKLDLKDAK